VIGHIDTRTPLHASVFTIIDYLEIMSLENEESKNEAKRGKQGEFPYYLRNRHYLYFIQN
jgi:hypothetical protein